MNLSRKWLDEFVHITANDKDFAEAMTLSGSKVEGTEVMGDCGACAGGCPTGCIKEDGGVYVINAGECIDCGSCVGNCPTGAIKPE